MERHYDALVVGAGIAGLASARLLTRAGLHVGLLEAEARAGGSIHTARLAVDGSEYWLELGAHTLFNSYRSLLTLFPETHLEEIVLRRRSLPFRLWDAGEVHSIVGALRWAELARTAPTAFFRRRAGQRVADYFGAIAGSRNYTEVIGPSLDALLCQPADDFPAELLFKQRIRTPDFPRSFSLQHGLSSLTERLAQGFELHLATPVRRLTRHREILRCETPQGEFIAPRLLLALPADQAARLLEPLLPAVAQRLARIPVQDVDTTAVVTPAKAVSLAPVAGLVGRNAPWYSMVSRDVISNPELRGFTFHFRPRLPPEERLEIVARILRIEPADVLATAHAHHRLPGLRLGHQARMESVDEELRHVPIGLAGNYFGGLSMEDCVARAAGEAQRLSAMESP